MESFIDRKYRLILFKCSDKEPVFTGSPQIPKWKLQCPLCGGSGASLIWLPARDTWKFLCDSSRRGNCGVHAEFPILLKIWNPNLYREYLQEREEAGTTGFGFNCPRLPENTARRGSGRSQRSFRRNSRAKSKTDRRDRQDDPE
jgi:hypothetical protein